MTQIAFDIDRMILEEHLAVTPWTGAPLHFTVDYYDPAELDAAYKRWTQERGTLDGFRRSHVWHADYAHCGDSTIPIVQTQTHRMYLYSVDTRCWKEHGGPREHCQCVGDLLYQAICPNCRWSFIADEDSTAAEAWHDHAMPGWRDLPVLSGIATHDGSGRPSKRAIDWIEQNYPAEWVFAGAPSIRPRTEIGNRAVNGRSPLGGYDFAAPAP